jgi:hypothetical protein
MDEDMEYVFQAGGDACGICLALDGSNNTAPPHPNCSCQIVSKEGEKECEYNLDWHDPVRHGDRPFDITIGGDLTVTCPDGTEVSESIEWDVSGYDPDGGWNDFVQPLIDNAVAELCGQCPESDPPLVV